MVEQVELVLGAGREALVASAARYAALGRVAEAAARQGVVVLAFGLGERRWRWVLEGEEAAITNVVRGVKVGTLAAQRARGVAIGFGPLRRGLAADPCAAVAWAHQAGMPPAPAPLADPWTSHRDLLGFRVAPFFDAAVVRERVDPRRVHALAGGGPVPARVSSAPGGVGVGLALRVAAAVRGVLPADRRCFRLFAHTARACGYSAAEVADALVLTARRARQLLQEPEPYAALALTALADPRLRVVP